jgi:DNA-binding NarL/FixJ family response regulator
LSPATSRATLIFRENLCGTSRAAIAKLLGVRPCTVKKHVHNLLQKTRDPSLDAAARRAMREAMNELDEGGGAPSSAGPGM